MIILMMKPHYLNYVAVHLTSLQGGICRQHPNESPSSGSLVTRRQSPNRMLSIIFYLSVTKLQESCSLSALASTQSNNCVFYPDVSDHLPGLFLIRLSSKCRVAQSLVPLPLASFKSELLHLGTSCVFHTNGF